MNEVKVDAFGLPPAGDARKDELKKRADELEEKASEQYKDVGTIPKEIFDPDREIQDMIGKDYLAVGLNHDIYITKWVNFVNQHGSKVWEAKADGWMVATGKEFPEAKHLLCEDNSIRVGDVMLMFIRKDEHFKLMIREEKKRLNQQLGIDAEIVDLVVRHPNVFTNLKSDNLGNMDEKLAATIKSRAATLNPAQRTALSHLGNRMKDGLIDGLPLK